MPHMKGVNQIRYYATVAALPAASVSNKGTVAFVANALNASQTAGTGTGNICFSNGTAWIRADTGAAAGA